VGVLVVVGAVEGDGVGVVDVFDVLLEVFFLPVNAIPAQNEPVAKSITSKTRSNGFTILITLS
jgi:hypothetical protein